MKSSFWQLIRFFVVGVINTLAGLSCIYLLQYFARVQPMIANFIGYAIGLSISFILNRVWTFKEQQNEARTSGPKFFGSAIIAYLINFGIVFLAVYVLKINSYLAQPFGIAVYTSFMFVACKFYVFKK